MELWRQLSLAEHYFQEVLDMCPEEPQSWRDLALILFRQGNKYHDHAIALIKQKEELYDTSRQMEEILQGNSDAVAQIDVSQTLSAKLRKSRLRAFN